MTAHQNTNNNKVLQIATHQLSTSLPDELVEYSSNQTLAYIMKGDRGAGAREKKGVPNEQKNEPENEQEC